MASHAIEFEGMQLYAPILYVLVFLLIFNFFLILRSRAIARRSGGPFFAPFHINRGVFYIHVFLCFSRRMIPLKEISKSRMQFFVDDLVVGVAMLSISNSEMEKPFPSFLVKVNRMNCWLKNSSIMLVSMDLKYIFNARIQSPEGNKTRI